MMKKILMLILCMMLFGCSCSTMNPTTTPTPTPSSKPTPTPSATPQTSSVDLKGYMDYMSANYTLNNPKPMDNLDGNAKEGYTFGYDSADFYLLRFDRSNSTASQWLSEAEKQGYIEVKVNNKTKKYYALVNQDVMLLYDVENLNSDFIDYFKKYPYQTGAENQSY